ncbi:MAG TPA: carbohydrate ABC transporter permease [Actinophytocola sp.]|uniref:carbohydrate ABC transporter permease n=1 Tax=Actinophytocola sp. TaxID=1872138 RepID=UPI002DBB5557|nr:carbohydrate ABC transporter permease [Actinophytocola sp.]HEU5474615.1 carbohydrate ABC transporter permease [Actinophytocola sp.]
MTLTEVRPPAPVSRPAGSGPRRPRRVAERSASAGFQAILAAWALVSVLPLIWAAITAFKPNPEVFASPWQLPSRWDFGNFARAWGAASIGQFFVNTVIVVSGALVLTMLLSTMVAYVVARYEFRGNRVIYYLFAGGLMFPVFLALVPLFFVVRNLGLLHSHIGLILVYAAYAMPFSVFFLVAFFRTLPTAVAEAALIDGCSHSGVFFRIMLPMARPGIVSVALFNVLSLWNQYLLPLVLNQGDKSTAVLTEGLAALVAEQGYASDWSALFAGMVIAMLPVLVVYLVFQRRVRQGFVAGALK